MAGSMSTKLYHGQEGRLETNSRQTHSGRGRNLHGQVSDQERPRPLSEGAAFGPWDSTKVKDVEFRSEYGTILRGIIATKRKRQGHFFRLALTDKIYLKQLGHS
jgi:hypothetical protein